jgi:soluble lytic murein transglycosylase
VHIKKPLMISLMALSCLIIVLSFFGVFMCQSCFSQEKEMAKVIDLIAKGNYSNAITVLKSLTNKAQDPYTKTQNQYFIATCYRKQNDWEKAISFYQLVAKEKSSRFADISLFRMAKHHQEIKDYKSAIAEYSEILNDHPNSICAIESLYQLAECYYNSKLYDNAIENYNKFTEKYPETSRSRLAEYRVGYVYQESQKFPEAYSQYQKVIRKYTETYAALTALDRIKLLKASSSINISREDNLYMGMVLFYAKQYKESREYFTKAINGTDELSAMPSYFIAQSYQKEGSYASAQKEYESIIKLYPKSQYEVDSQYNIGQCVWSLGKTSEAISLLSSFASKYPESKFADDTRYQIAKSYLDAKQYAKSLDAYNELVEKHPNGDFADKALWDMGWCYMKLKKKDKSASAFQKLISDHPDSKLAGSARFWAGMNYEDDGQIEEAVDAYESAMEYKDWYYSDRAKKRIEALVKSGKIDKEIQIQYKKAEYDEFLPILSNVRKYTPLWVQVSLSFGVFDDTLDVYTAANEAGVALESAYYNLSVCYKMMGDYRRSWAYAWQLTKLPNVKGKKGELPRQIYSKLYPTVYSDFVFQYAKSNKVDPYLVFAVIFEESRFDTKAVSRSNANGLMQIMPDTGKDCAKQVDLKDFKVENLFDPEVNIKLGSWYLSGLISNFNKRAENYFSDKGLAKPELDYSDIAAVLALGGYNGGPTRVKKWMGEYGIDDIDEFIESIPMQEPRNYIKKVMDSYETYKSLYGG